MQAPMISSPLKQTNEIDWVTPLKGYIRNTYGDDPERYNEECSTLNRLRQDMRGAAKDTAAGRDLLYRYYGQLELLDLRFPVDETHIKVLFTWFDAFTQKPTSQHSLAFEKASLIFNISAVLSCYAAAQNRTEDSGLKTAYHSFQASAGMFTYINENFLHAPSTDLNHSTVRTLINIMLAQAQEVFLEKQILDKKKSALIAKLASQAAFFHSQALEGVQENVNNAVFENVWLHVTQIKASHFSSMAQYYQALADNEAGSHGTAIARLQAAEGISKEAGKAASRMPDMHPVNANIGTDASQILVEITRKMRALISEKLAECNKDNDFIYHTPVPSEASLSAVTNMPAAKAIPVNELYQGQDVHRIIGADIFQKIVPMSVTESASLYDEEKAKLVRAEAERVETAEGEMAASLDYLKLPGSLEVLKGGKDQDMAVDGDFVGWCEELTGHPPFSHSFEEIAADKARIGALLDQSSKNLDMEESVCEKMRSKYGGEWTQQPSSRLTTTLRNDIKNYRGAVVEAGTSDSQLQATLRQHEAEFEEMRTAAESGEIDLLYQRAMLKAGAKSGSSSSQAEANLLDADFEDGTKSVKEQITQVEDLLRKLNLIKRERASVLKDLKDTVRNDDISQVLILNKRAITSQDHQLFKTELEKFKPYQTRILQANHKQSSVMKELSKTYGTLLQDKRVRTDQSKYEMFSRQRNAVLSRYRRSSQAFADLSAGLERARVFYSETKGTVESLSQNVSTFVSNRKAEGGELLSSIEKKRSMDVNGSTNLDRERLQELMGRMNMNKSPGGAPTQVPPSSHSSPYQQAYNSMTTPPGNTPYQNQVSPPHFQSQESQQNYQPPFNPNQHSQDWARSSPADPRTHTPMSHQSGIYSTAGNASGGYVPPPPPPPRQHTGSSGQARPSGSAQKGQDPADPWAGLSGWR